MTDIANLDYSFKDETQEDFQLELREDGIHSLETTYWQNTTAGDLTLQTLSNWGIQHVFGKVDDSVFADALARQQAQGLIQSYDTRYESTAAFAASAYGKLTSRPAACLAKAGSAATNLLNGLWDANVDKVPVVAITGPEIKQISTFGKVAHWSQNVQRNSHFSEATNLACRTAILNRGVSHLIFPNDIPKHSLTEPMQAGLPKGRLPSQNISPPKDALQDAIELLRSSERPVIIVGQGARDRMEPVIQLAEQLRAPVITTLKGKGLISDNHPLAAGVLGLYGTPIAKQLMGQSDAFLVFGASFGSHSGITPERPTVQVDYDLATLARFHTVDVPVWGEISVTAQALSDDFLGDMWTEDQTTDIATCRTAWDEEKKQEAASNSAEIRTTVVYKALNEVASKDAIITIEINKITDKFGRYFDCQQQAILMSGEPGTTGFAFPAAIGAWSATQEIDSSFAGRQVISISADDGFGQNAAEMNTAVEHGMNITHIMLNNRHETRYGLSSKSFADYATSCGALGIQVSRPDELPEALDKALKHPGPALLEVIINDINTPICQEENS